MTDHAFPPYFRVREDALEPARLRECLLAPAAGGFASFEGWVREQHDGRAVDGLRYEAYAALADAEGLRIVEEALQRFDVIAVACEHRIGTLAIGDLAVWVGVSAAHRDAAFAACRWIIDEVKARVPIWKHERYRDGSADWLHPDLR